MAPMKNGKVDGGAAPEGAGDCIGALPDDALHHVLSFLPAEEAVRTCVLARRWRHLWKSATGLRLGCGGDGNEYEMPYGKELRHFVNHLLLLRKRDSSIHTCELRLRSCSCNDDKLCLNLWIRHVVDREVRVLRLEIKEDMYPYVIELDDLPLVSQHLAKLALFGVGLSGSLCNFSNCPNLQHLEIAKSDFHCEEILSESLERLSIGKNCYFYRDPLICTPNLVSLTLDVHFRSYPVPVLGTMPSLKEAFVRNSIEDCHEEDCFSCGGKLDDYDYNKNKCFLLQGLSKAENLTLMCDYNGAIFHRDMNWCPTFNNLRVLLLNEWWFEHPDFYGLNCILKHSPVLEKLTLHFFLKGTKHQVEIIGMNSQMERSATISKHLKEIEVKCKVVDEQVHKVLKFLGTFGIYFLFK